MKRIDVLSTLDGTQEQLVDYHKIMAISHLRKQHMDEAVGELKKALGFRKRGGRSLSVHPGSP